jgi:hypothetical protein
MPVSIIEYCDNLMYLQYKKARCDLASIMFNVNGFNVVCWYEWCCATYVWCWATCVWCTSHSAQIFPQYSLTSFRVSILLCKVLKSVLNTVTSILHTCIIFLNRCFSQCRPMCNILYCAPTPMFWQKIWILTTHPLHNIAIFGQHWNITPVLSKFSEVSSLSIQ